MSYQVLARKWRPASFQQMVGQEHVLQALANALDSNRLHHAYLFTGTRGVGKTTIARIFAKSLNCATGIKSEPCGSCSSCTEVDQGRSLDLIEIDAASRTGVDDMRELLDNLQYAPTHCRFKVYLIDEVHMLSKHSFNALLKTLEEPPAHVKFLLATTDPQKVPVTVLSRCLQFNLKRMSREQILTQLEYLTKQEQVTADVGALGQLAAAADGSMRDALSLLDQAIGYGGGEVQQTTVETMLGSISRDNLQQLFDALMAQQVVALVQAARKIIEYHPDYQRVCAEMIRLLQQVALAQVDAQLVDESEFASDLLRKYAHGWSPDEVQLYYQIILQGRQDLLISPDQAAGFEMLVLRLLAFSPGTDDVVEAAPTVKKKPSEKPALALLQSSPPRVPEAAQEQPSAIAAKALSGSDAAVDTLPAAAPASVAGTALESKQLSVPSNFDWPQLGYQLGLSGLAQEIVANCACESYRDNCLTLALSRELYKLATVQLESEILQALQQNLGVSLRLELVAREAPGANTPQQAKIRRLEQERLTVIDAIKTEAAVLKLQQAFAAELDEASVMKIEANSSKEVIQ